MPLAAQETQFVLNSFSFLIWGVLVFWMSAGFTMLESGSVRSRNASVICLKNVGLLAITGLTFYLVGYTLMYGSVEIRTGDPSFLSGSPVVERSLLGGDESATAAVLGNGNSVMSHWLFQMAFVASTASIVSGTLAERVRLWSFFVFVVVLTSLIYPTVGAWTWGGGWLDRMGFQDFAGSTVVHSTGGWAALAGAAVVGARRGKFNEDGTANQTPPSNVPLATLGMFILWMGWFAFNGGSHLRLSGVINAVAVSNVVVNTNLAACSGFAAAIALSGLVFRRVDLMISLSGAIAGLVAISAGPDFTGHYWAIPVGAIGGTISTLGLKLLEKRRIDDGVGAIPAHLFSGIWGTIAVGLGSGGSIPVQLLGILAIGAFVFPVSLIFWLSIGQVIGVRITADAERRGKDLVELGIKAYPEFVVLPEQDQ